MKKKCLMCNTKSDGSGEPALMPNLARTFAVRTRRQKAINLGSVNVQTRAFESSKLKYMLSILLRGAAY